MNALKKILGIIILMTIILIPQEGIAQFESVPFSVEYEGDGNNHSILLPIAIPPETPVGVDVTFNFSVVYEVMPYGDSWTSEVSFSMTSSDGDTIVPTTGPNLPGSSDNNIPIFGAVDGTYIINIDDVSGGFYINVQDNFDNTELDGHFSGFMEYTLSFPCVAGTPCDDGNPNTINDQLDDNCNCIGTPVLCEIVASASPPFCNDNGTPADPSDDTYTFEVTVINDTGTSFNDDMGNNNQSYGSVISYGPFPVLGGDITITFSDAENAGCMTTVTVSPPVDCPNNVSPPDIQPHPNITPNDNCGETNDVYGDVLSDVLPLHFRLFTCPDDTPSPPDVSPHFDENGEPSIPGMTLLPDADIQTTSAIPSTTFCIENLAPGRYYLLVWNDFLKYDIECFVVPPKLEVVGPIIVPQDKTGKKHNAYLFVKGGVKPYKYSFYKCPEDTPDDFQPDVNTDGTPDLSGMIEIQQEHVEYNGFLCIQNLDAGRHYVLIQDSAGRWKWICIETPKELKATLEDFVPTWLGDTRIYIDVCGGEPDYKFNLFTCPEPAPDELPTPEYAADGTLVVEGMTEVPGFTYTQVTPERICIDLPPGTYYLLVRDSGGRCTWVCIDIPVVEPLDAELFGEMIPIGCDYIRLYVRVKGGVPPYNFQPYTCPDPDAPLPDPTFPDGHPSVPMDPFHDYEWEQVDPNTFCFTFPRDLKNIYILFWGQALCWDWICLDFDDVPIPPGWGGYCDAQGQDTSKGWIEHVSFCDISNTSGNDGGYGNYTTAVAEVAAGQTQQIVLTPQFSSLNIDVRWYVWIDFNQDNTFGFNELVVKSPYSSTAVPAAVAIPSDAVPGATRMRVKMVIGKSLLVNPCGNFRRGEVEDYTVNISGGNGAAAPPFTTFKRNLSDTDLAIKVFPNPVREQATIEFELTDASPVTLVVTDANGRPLNTLIDNERMPKGTHQVTFNRINLPTGIYYCTLKTEETIHTKQMTLIQ